MHGSDVTAAWHAAAPPPPPPMQSGSGIDSGPTSPYPLMPKPQSKSLSRMASAAMQSLRSSPNGKTFGSAGRGAAGPSKISMSSGCSFDKLAVGDDLPASAHAPEPERPISRNAVARASARERERQRANTYSPALGSHSSMSLLDYNREQMLQKQQAESMQAHSPSQPRISLLDRAPSRARHDSSPAMANDWSEYKSPSMAEMPPPPTIPTHHISGQSGFVSYPGHAGLAGQHAAPHQYQHDTYPRSADHRWPQGTEQYAWNTQPPPQQQQQQQWFQKDVWAQTAGMTQPEYQEHHQIHSQDADHHWQAVPQAFPPARQAVWSGSPHEQISSPAYSQKSFSPVPPSPYSIASSSPLPAASQLQSWCAAPSIASDSYSCTSPSRSSSRSSTESRAQSVISFVSSVSSSVRRALPQPPPASLSHAAPTKAFSGDRNPSSPTNEATMTPTSMNVAAAAISKHDSVRLAAEEIMARGSPRRRGVIPGALRHQRDQTITEERKSDAVSTCGVEEIGDLMGTVKVSNGSADADRTGRAKEISERRPLQAVFAPQQKDGGLQDLNKTASQVDTTPRAVSPRPVRAYTSQRSQPTIEVPARAAVPDRPRSRGPKDGRETQAMATIGLPILPPMPSKSPPPDRRVPDLGFDNSSSAGCPGVPTITIGAPEDDDDGTRQVHDGNAFVGMPQATTPMSSYDQLQSKVVPRASSICVSTSASSHAQRSTSSIVEPSRHAAQQSHRSARSLAAPALVSASSVGSGAACAGCQRYISGRVVHAMSQSFHPDCFACDHCGENLEHVAFYEHEGRAYCHFDYHELFSKRCFHCRTPIVDQRYITINDVELTGNGQPGQTQERCYHDMHFFCANCGDPFLDPKLSSDAAGCDPLAEAIEDEDGVVRYGGREFVVHKGYPYCERCHVSLHKPKCRGCLQPIVDAEYLTALKGKWHVGCFCCGACKRPIQSDNFFVRDDVAYDERCYKIKLRSEV